MKYKKNICITQKKIVIAKCAVPSLISINSRNTEVKDGQLHLNVKIDVRNKKSVIKNA